MNQDHVADGMTARHSSASAEHYTPSYIVEPARRVLGSIDLDPASCALANDTVQARTIFTKADDGLGRLWVGRVFLNPPGGKVDGQSSQKTWWFTLADEWMAGRTTAAIFIGFSVEILQTTQVRRPPGLPAPAGLPHCFPSRRVAYMNDKSGTLKKGASPPHSSVIVYLPPRESIDSWTDGILAFEREFSTIGACCGQLAQPCAWMPR